MLGHREFTFEDYWLMVLRRKWLIIVPAVLVPIITFVVSLRLPDRFTSQTLVLVEQQRVPDSFVKPVVTEDLAGRLATMREQILSRTRLQPIIEQQNLFRDMPAASMEDKLDAIRNAIQLNPIKTEAQGGRPGVQGFYVSFTASDARTAQQVCGQITSMFMDENLRNRANASEGTTQFIRTQLAESKRQLDEQDAKLADFKKRYIGQLPGTEQNSFSMLASLNTQLDAATQALGRLEQDKTYTETVLAQQVQEWSTRQTTATKPETLDQQLTAAQTLLTSLQAKYTATHPDVIKAKGDVDAIKRKIEEAKNAPPAPANEKPGTEPLPLQQLRAQLKAMDVAIQGKRNDQRRVQQAIDKYQARLQLSPGIEEQYKALTRDYNTALQFYNDLLGKKNQSEMATDLERKQQGEQFRIMDPPNLPEKPTFPNRPLFALGGLGGGLGIGLGLALLLEFKDKSIRNDRDVQALLELPTLAMMPHISPNGQNDSSLKALWRRSRDKVNADHRSVGA